MNREREYNKSWPLLQESVDDILLTANRRLLTHDGGLIRSGLGLKGFDMCEEIVDTFISSDAGLWVGDQLSSGAIVCVVSVKFWEGRLARSYRLSVLTCQRLAILPLLL